MNGPEVDGKAGGARRIRRDRRAEILETATRLFCERSYHQTTLDDVALEIGFTKPAIYYYFESKEEILFEIHNRLILLALERMDAIAHGDDGPAARLRTMLRTHMDHVLDMRDAIKVFYSEQGLLSAEREAIIRTNRGSYEHIFHEVYREGVEVGEFRPLDPRIAIGALLGACRSVYMWLPRIGEVDESAAVAQVADLLTFGYVTEEFRRAEVGPPSAGRAVHA
jgi:TetR/AcrR family transcriptional regulator, cholesterol catabolism regulator